MSESISTADEFTSATAAVEAAYHAASRIALALFRLSIAVNENRHALSGDAADQWPDNLRKLFYRMAKAGWQLAAVTNGHEWIPIRLTEVCGVSEPSMHAAMMACANYAITTYAVAPEFGWPSAETALARFANCPISTIDGMLRVERLQALKAIKAARDKVTDQAPRATRASEQGEEAGGQDGAKSLVPSRQKAYGQYLDAVRRKPELANATDREVYDAVKEQLESGESLPIFGTWSRYLRDARSFHDANKHEPRTGREHGKSIVRHDQI